VKYSIFITPTALDMLSRISDQKIRIKIRNAIDGLSEEPEKKGKPLLGEFIGFRSLRAAGQRYRVIYKVEKKKIVVFIVAVGRRKEGSKEDIYTLAKRLLKLKLLER
jgi:mRNA interferase RelE/StbE